MRFTCINDVFSIKLPVPLILEWDYIYWPLMGVSPVSTYKLWRKIGEEDKKLVFEGNEEQLVDFMNKLYDNFSRLEKTLYNIKETR